jgi:hypothetical protein
MAIRRKHIPPVPSCRRNSAVLYKQLMITLDKRQWGVMGAIATTLALRFGRCGELFRRRPDGLAPPWVKAS